MRNMPYRLNDNNWELIDNISNIRCITNQSSQSFWASEGYPVSVALISSDNQEVIEKYDYKNSPITSTIQNMTGGLQYGDFRKGEFRFILF